VETIIIVTVIEEGKIIKGKEKKKTLRREFRFKHG
jgi:hypothetical protein